MTVVTDQDVGAKRAEAPLLLTCKQVARLLNASERSVWAWSYSGRIPPPIRLGTRAVRWRRSDIEDWIRRAPPAG